MARSFLSPRAMAQAVFLAATAWGTLVCGATAQSQPQNSTDASDLDDVIVTGAPFGVTQRATTIATDVLDEEALSVAPSGSLGDVLNGRPGVRSTDFAPGASRPVIRGLSGQRVQVLTNGIGLIDASSVSPDHQVAVDPGEASRIEVVRGPATLVYGGSAIGGVVNIIDDRIPTGIPEGGVDGVVSTQVSSVDNGRSGFAHLTLGAGHFALNVDGVTKRTDDYDIPGPAISRQLAASEGIPRGPGGTQPNSASETSAYGFGASWIAENAFLGASYKNTDSEYGTVAEPNVFIQLQQEREDVRGEYRFEDGPVQALRGSFGHADYTHTEFDGPGQPGTIFQSSGEEGRVDLVMRERSGWNSAYGVQGLKRNFQAVGTEAYVPTTDISEGGVYTVQRLDLGGYGFEGGLRFDRHTITATPIGTSREVSRDFDSFAASAAVFARPATGLFLGLSLSRTERAPSEVELFADGVHVATAAYEKGDPTLDSERVVTLEGTLNYDAGPFSTELHVYGARYDGYIDEVQTGASVVFDGEAFPVFRYVQTGADFYGFEGQATYALWEDGDRALSLEGEADFVHAETDAGPVARIPPYAVTSRLAFTSTRYDARAEVRHVGEQTDLAAFERPTDSYTLVSLYGAVRPFDDRNVTVFVEGRNLTDTEAREHVSFLKDIAPLPGRNVRVGVSYRF